MTISHSYAELHTILHSQPDLWNPDRLTITTSGGIEVTFRGLKRGDEICLEEFAAALGERSRELFAPYPWHAPEQARSAYTSAISRHLACLDVAYLLFSNALPVAYTLLWDIGAFRGDGPRLPMFGVAVADAFQGRGIGSACVRFMQCVAESLGADGVELTTAQTNRRATRIYEAAGYATIGIRRIPLGCHPTQSLAASETNWRDEYYMLWRSDRDRQSLAGAAGRDNSWVI